MRNKFSILAYFTIGPPLFFFRFGYLFFVWLSINVEGSFIVSSVNLPSYNILWIWLQAFTDSQTGKLGVIVIWWVGTHVGVSWYTWNFFCNIFSALPAHIFTHYLWSTFIVLYGLFVFCYHLLMFFVCECCIYIFLWVMFTSVCFIEMVRDFVLVP